MRTLAAVASCVLSTLVVGTLPVQAQDADTRPAMSSLTTDYSSYESLLRPNTFTGPEGNGRPGARFFNKGAQAFDRRQYAFAIEMYEVAASWAYKPAEYNLAVIYAKGLGVPVDLPRALAWISLAAERGRKRYEDARDAVQAALTAEQLARADAILEQLAPKYGDGVALQRAKARWRETRNGATGSRLGFVGALVIGPHHPAGANSSNVSTTAMELTSGTQTDGATAYLQLRETDNPYDPALRQATGTATVKPLIAGKSVDSNVETPRPAPEKPHNY